MRRESQPRAGSIAHKGTGHDCVRVQVGRYLDLPHASGDLLNGVRLVVVVDEELVSRLLAMLPRLFRALLQALLLRLRFLLPHRQVGRRQSEAAPVSVWATGGRKGSEGGRKGGGWEGGLAFFSFSFSIF